MPPTATCAPTAGGSVVGTQAAVAILSRASALRIFADVAVPFSAMVLAAGRSQRMGTDKALLEWNGVPLWRHQRDILWGAGAAEVFLSARPEQSWAVSAPQFTAVVHDALPDCGPIIGITAALERAAQVHVAVLAIDLPHVDAAWFQALLARCDEKTGCGARHAGYFEPLAAVYPRELKWLAWERIARGDYSLQGLLAEAEARKLMRIVELTPSQERLFHNWNRPEDAPAEAKPGS